MANNKTSVSLHNIEGINSIDELSKHYEVIRKHAKMLFKGDERFEDLTQDLFIKLDAYFKKYPEKIINGGFVSNTLRNMIRNIYKSDKTSKIDRNIVLTDFNNEDMIMYDPFETEDNISRKEDDERKYEIIEQRLSELTWEERTLIEYSLVMNLTEISKKTEIPYQNIIYTINKAKKKLGIIK